MTAGTLQVTITMNLDTVTALLDSGYSLLAFSAVASSDLAGRPLVWSRMQRYSETTVFQWSCAYGAYTSVQPLPVSAGEVVVPGFNAPISPGQELTVTDAGGDGTAGTGVPGMISIVNSTTSPFTCGVSQQVNGASAPVCALPLHGLHMQIVQPLPSVLLLFSTGAGTPGAVVETATDPGLLIDMTSVAARDVSYDIDAGWSCGGGIWGVPVAAGTDLVPLLVQQSPPLAALVVQMEVLLQMGG